MLDEKHGKGHSGYKSHANLDRRRGLSVPKVLQHFQAPHLRNQREYRKTVCYVYPSTICEMTGFRQLDALKKLISKRRLSTISFWRNRAHNFLTRRALGNSKAKFDR